MGIYDKTMSVYDNLDCLENDSTVDEIDSNDLNEAKLEISKLDDGINDIIAVLEPVDGLHTDEELTLQRMNEFFDEELPEILKGLYRIRGRLY